LFLCSLTGCADDSCALEYSSVEPSHRCEALNCNRPDSLKEWTEEVTDPETGGTTKTNWAECRWGCVALENGARARVIQTYSRVQGEGNCIELVDESIDKNRADCDRDCETAK
jgi:hypothetical protein